MLKVQLLWDPMLHERRSSAIQGIPLHVRSGLPHLQTFGGFGVLHLHLCCLVEHEANGTKNGTARVTHITRPPTGKMSSTTMKVRLMIQSNLCKNMRLSQKYTSYLRKHPISRPLNKSPLRGRETSKRQLVSSLSAVGAMNNKLPAHLKTTQSLARLPSHITSFQIQTHQGSLSLSTFKAKTKGVKGGVQTAKGAGLNVRQLEPPPAAEALRRLEWEPLKQATSCWSPLKSTQKNWFEGNKKGNHKLFGGSESYFQTPQNRSLSPKQFK